MKHPFKNRSGLRMAGCRHGVTTQQVAACIDGDGERVAPAFTACPVLSFVVHTPQRIIALTQLKGLWISRVSPFVASFLDQTRRFKHFTRRAVRWPVTVRLLSAQKIHDLLGAKAQMGSLGG